jgi:hypothetical protein
MINRMQWICRMLGHAAAISGCGTEAAHQSCCPSIRRIRCIRSSMNVDAGLAGRRAEAEFFRLHPYHFSTTRTLYHYREASIGRYRFRLRDLGAAPADACSVGATADV